MSEELQTLHNLMMMGHANRKLASSQQHLNHYRESGLSMPASPPEDNMQIFATGPVTLHNPAPSPPPEKPAAPAAPSGIKTALLAGSIGLAAAGIPAAGAIGYLLNRVPEPVIQKTEEVLEMSLLREEDLLPASGGGKAGQ